MDALLRNSLVALALLTQVVPAQFLGLGGSIEAESPEYRLRTATNSRSSFLSQLTSQGDDGYQFAGPFVSGESSVNLFVRDLGTSRTFAYSVASSPSSVGGTLSQLNSNGAAGRAFVGFYALGEDIDSIDNFNLFVEATGDPRTFEYRLEPSTSSASAFLNRSNNLGSEGWQYLSPIFVGFSVQDLFVRTNVARQTWSYRLLGSPAAGTELSQLNAQGRDGYSWRGGLFFGESSRVLYERDNLRDVTVSYTTRAETSTRSSFSSQLNSQSREGRYFVAPVFFGTPQNLYAQLNESTSSGSNGIVIRLSRDGTLCFVLETSGAYQLQSSLTLNGDWQDVGEPMEGEADEKLTWTVGIGDGSDRRFYRVVLLVDEGS